MKKKLQIVCLVFLVAFLSYEGYKIYPSLVKEDFIIVAVLFPLFWALASSGDSKDKKFDTVADIVRYIMSGWFIRTLWAVTFALILISPFVYLYRHGADLFR